jgi:polysaccharide export outer membrane protein
MKMDKKTRRPINGQHRAEEQDLCGLAIIGLSRLAAAVLFIARILALGMAGAFLITGATAQTTPASAPGEQQPNCDNKIRSTYLLGPDDQLEISGPELTDMPGKPLRIDGEGDIEVPLAGTVHVDGLTVQQTEQKLDEALGKYIRHPQVVVNVVEVRSQPVSVLGAVNSPGVHQVQGHKTVLEMLASAGGIRQDAGYSIRITRELEWGCIPLPGAHLDASGKYSVAEVNLRKIMDAKTPEDNIQIFPHDVISVPKAEMVYVIGEVHRSGGFVLGEHQSISVLQALSLAEGLNTGADPRHAKILRLKADADQREELKVDVKDALNGKQPDFPLQGEDILFIPGSTGKKAALRGLEAAIQTGTGLAIWRVP